MMEHSSVGLICVDHAGLVVATNDRAASILTHRDGFRSNRSRLRLCENAENAELERILNAAVSAPPKEATGGSMMVGRWDCKRFSIHVCPVKLPAAPEAVPSDDAIAAIILVVDPARNLTIDPERVSAALGLTPAEGRVAAALAEGNSVREIAAAAQRAESTVRWTVKNIRAKLGSSRQADIIRMVLSAVAVALPLPMPRTTDADASALRGVHGSAPPPKLGRRQAKQ